VLYVDAEESWIQDALDGLVEEMMEKYNLQKPVIFNTIQLYRNDRLAFLERSIHSCKK
jgi:proline dehydrogenase